MPPRSPSAPEKDRFAHDSANDLTALLEITELEGPYVLVGHSYGGIALRCFFSLQPEHVVGVVLLECATALMLALYPRLPPPEFDRLSEHVDYEAIAHLKEESGMSDAEWNYALEAQSLCRGFQREDTHDSARRLAGEYQISKRVMGDRPLSVVRFDFARDFEIVYNEAVRKGYESEEEREKVRAYIDGCKVFHEQLQRAQLRLSRDAEFVAYLETGHDTPIRRPKVVVEVVKRLLKRVKEKQNL